MERGFASYLVIGLMLMAWLGTYVLKSKLHRAGAWFVALTMAFGVNLFSPLQPGVERFGLWFFGTLLGAIGSGVYFARLLSSGDFAIGSSAQSSERPGEGDPAESGSAAGPLCMNCNHSEPREGESTVRCSLQDRAVPSHYACSDFDGVVQADAVV